MQQSFPTYRLFSAAAALVAVFCAVSFVSAWSGPPNNPPSNNVAPPVNVGDSAQGKTGLLGLANFQFHPGAVPTHGVEVGSVLTAIDDTGTVGWRAPSDGENGSGAVLSGDFCYAVYGNRWANNVGIDGYYLKALLKSTDDNWDGNGSIWCYSQKGQDTRMTSGIKDRLANESWGAIESTIGETYNEIVAMCNSNPSMFGSHGFSCPPIDPLEN